MGKKQKPEIQKHLHKDIDVTTQRVRAFGKERQEVQIQVLANLRLIAGDQSSSTKLAIAALAISLVTWMLTPAGIDIQGLPSFAMALVSGLLGVFAVVTLSPVIIPASIHLGRQDRARVWLAAYEDEIQRRASH